MQVRGVTQSGPLVRSVGYVRGRVTHPQVHEQPGVASPGKAGLNDTTAPRSRSLDNPALPRGRSHVTATRRRNMRNVRNHAGLPSPRQAAQDNTTWTTGSETASIAGGSIQRSADAENEVRAPMMSKTISAPDAVSNRILCRSGLEPGSAGRSLTSISDCWGLCSCGEGPSTRSVNTTLRRPG